MKRKLLTAAVLAALVLPFAPSHASTDSANYIAAQAVIVGTPHPAGAPTPKLGIGGYTFPGRSTAPIKITVSDASGINAGIPVVLCVGPCDSYQKGFCAPASGVITLPGGLKANETVRVGVEAFEPGGVWANVPECPGSGTTGTVTVTW